jgi:hypothetical protein
MRKEKRPKPKGKKVRNGSKATTKNDGSKNLKGE